MDHKTVTRRKIVLKYLFLLLGTILAAAGLEIFLIPNNIIDGGIVGISIILAHLSGLELGLITFALNIPFLFYGYQQIGKTFVFNSLFASASFSIWLVVFSRFPGFTSDMILATVFGGIVLGFGVGFIIRNGGSLDGTEIVAIVINEKSPLSVGQIILVINIFIYALAGFIFGPNPAMYSLITYFLVHKMIDLIVEGFDEARAAMIISSNGKEISEAIWARLGRGTTFLAGDQEYNRSQKQILYTVINRLEIAKLKAIVYDKDEEAFVTIHNVSDFMHGKYKKKAIH